jgi:2-phosphoglycerate kinase
MNKIILIGGAPTVGKSFIARKVSEELKLPWISTDGIREMMRKITNKKDFPGLFHFNDEKITAEKYLSTHTPQQIVDSQNAESKDVWKGVEAIVDTDYVWKDYVIEGVAVIPELVNKIDAAKHEIKPIFLVDENEERVRETVYTRGLWDNADTYSDEVKEIEVQWVDLFNKYIKSETDKHGYTVYKIDEREPFIENLIVELRGWLKM